MRNVVLLLAMCVSIVAQTTSANEAVTAYPELDIYLITDEAPAPDGQETDATLRLRNIMAKVPELRYQLHYVSWMKALRQVEQRRDALIFQIIRTPEREPRYRWLVVDQQVSINLVALSQQPKKDWPLSRLKQDKDIRIACPANTAQCEILFQQGFTANQIVQLSPLQQESLERVLLAGRVDFIVVAPVDLRRNMQRLNIAASAYQISHQLTLVEDYLAGGLLLDTAVFELFQQKTQSPANSTRQSL